MAKKLNHLYPDENNYIDLEPQKPGNGKKPQKKTRSGWSRMRTLVMFLISLAIVAAIVYGVVSYVRKEYFDPVASADSTAVEVTIPKGASLNKISDILYDNDLIRNKQVFKLYVDFSDMSSKLKAGTYELSKNMDFDDLIYALQEGKSDSNVAKVKFLEGLTIDDFSEVLIESGILKNTTRYQEIATSGEAFAQDYPVIADVIAKEAEKEPDQKRKYVLEGYLFPDTYEYYTDASEEEIIKKQLNRFNEIFSDEYKARAEELGMTVDDVVTLASIIEKEAKPDDFSKVSAVFHNRLNKDETLGSDATIMYALGLKNVYNIGDKVNTPSAYNTRQNKGLPPGPIGNPSKAAIEAALYPFEEYMQEGDEYMYFTLTDPATGVLEFNKTLEEHNEAVAKYRPLWDAADAAAGVQ